jgi:prophage DNA circulation protein
MAEMWDKLEPNDRAVLARVCGIPEAQLALTRVSSVLLRLLGALGHVTAVEARKREELEAQLRAEKAKIDADLHRRLYSAGLQANSDLMKALTSVRMQIEKATLEGHTQQAEQLHRLAERMEHDLRQETLQDKYALVGRHF